LPEVGSRAWGWDLQIARERLSEEPSNSELSSPLRGLHKYATHLVFPSHHLGPTGFTSSATTPARSAAGAEVVLAKQKVSASRPKVKPMHDKTDKLTWNGLLEFSLQTWCWCKAIGYSASSKFVLHRMLVRKRMPKNGTGIETRGAGVGSKSSHIKRSRLSH
jgi:hypothetical protein